MNSVVRIEKKENKAIYKTGIHKESTCVDNQRMLTESVGGTKEGSFNQRRARPIRRALSELGSFCSVDILKHPNH